MRENTFFSQVESGLEILKPTVGHFKHASFSCILICRVIKVYLCIFNNDFREIFQAWFILRISSICSSNHHDVVKYVFHTFIEFSNISVSHINISLGKHTSTLVNSISCVFFSFFLSSKFHCFKSTSRSRRVLVFRLKGSSTNLVGVRIHSSMELLTLHNFSRSFLVQDHACRLGGIQSRANLMPFLEDRTDSV